MDDQLYNTLEAYLAETKYPEDYDKNKKRTLRKTAANYTLKDGLLHYKYDTTAEPVQVIKATDKTRVLQSVHDDPTSGGHFAWERMWSKLRNRFYWKGMSVDCKTYCSSCEICQRHNKMAKTTPDELTPVAAPLEVMKQVGIDLIGPFQETASGNKYAVVMVDYTSKWPEAEGIPDASARSVAKFIYNMTCRYGVFEAMVHDQGRCFINKINDELFELLGTKQHICSAYHPQSNGLTERYNCTLKSGITKLINDKQDDWDEKIPGLLFAYRTSRHSSSKFVPYRVLFGREPVLPIEMELKRQTQSEIPSESEIEEMTEVMIDIRSKVLKTNQANIRSAQAKYKQYFDEKHQMKKETLEVGDKVLMRNMRNVNRVGGKLDPKFLGPYVVQKSLGKGRYKLKNCSSDKALKCVYNKSQLRRFTERKEDHCKANENETSGLEDKKTENKRSMRIRTQENEEIEKQIQAAQNEESETEDSENREPMGQFKPLSSMSRKSGVKRLQLHPVKMVSFGKLSNLEAPKRIYKIRGDGNCYFRSLSYILTGDESQHHLLREKVVAHMTHPEMKGQIEGYVGGSIEEYMEQSKMTDNGVWATDAEIMASASLLGHDICVFCESGGKDGKQWCNYPASFINDNPSEEKIYIQNLCQHFDVVLSVQ